MSIKTTFDFDEDKFKRAVMAKASEGFDAVAEQQRQKVEAMTCPTHGAHPRVTITKNTDFDSRLVAGEFCCQEFKDTVTTFLQSMTDQSRKAA